VAELLARPAPAQDPEPVALLTVADVAKALDVAEGTVRSWVSRNKLTPAQRDNGRMLFDPADIAALT
jgi:DNA-binding transcriptional MerR regulator